MSDAEKQLKINIVGKIDKTFNSTFKSVQKSLSSFQSRLSGISNQIDRGFGGSTKSIKRFGFALVGVHSIYRLLTKASNAYLSQDLETSAKLRSAWIGLGSMFAVLFEQIANYVIKAVAYINLFIRALTGVDLLARAQAKSFNKAAKSVQAFKGALAGIDEITNIDVQTGGSADVDSGWADAFNDIELNPKITEFLENVAAFIKEWKDEILLLLGVLASFWVLGKLGAILSGFAKVGGAILTLGKGAVVLAPLLTSFLFISDIVKFLEDTSLDNLIDMFFSLVTVIGSIGVAIGLFTGKPLIAIMGLITVAGGLFVRFREGKKDTQDLEKATISLADAERDLKKAKEDLTNASLNQINAYKNATQATKDLEDAEKKYKISGQELEEQIKHNTRSLEDLSDEELVVLELHYKNIDAQERYTKSNEELTQATKDVTEAELKLTDSQKLVLKGQLQQQAEAVKTADQYKEYEKEVTKAFEDGAISADEAADLIALSLKGIDDASRKTWTENLPNDIKEGLDINKYDSFFDRFKRGWNKFWNSITGKKTVDVDINTKASGASGSFADGIQQVPRDMLAVLHKDEAVVPAKFNKDSYFRGSNVTTDNSETNALLRELIETTRDKDSDLYITEESIGNAAIRQINKTNRNLGRGVI